MGWVMGAPIPTGRRMQSTAIRDPIWAALGLNSLASARYITTAEIRYIRKAVSLPVSIEEFIK